MKRVTVRELRQRMVKALSPQITDSTAVASGDLEWPSTALTLVNKD